MSVGRDDRGYLIIMQSPFIDSDPVSIVIVHPLWRIEAGMTCGSVIPLPMRWNGLGQTLMTDQCTLGRLSPKEL
jgi:hypothetical protein